jgi:predicted membrane-bound mannosyltransferase
MFACKETAILHLFALAAAAFVFRVRNLRGKSFARSLRSGPLLAAAGTFLVLLVILFTWVGRNGNGLPALLRAVPDVLARAVGQGHQKPFWYYGQLLTGGWSGGLLFAPACLGLLISIRKRNPSPYGLLAYYAFFIAAIYSLIPYKTPWLALNLWLPLALLAARAVESLRRWAATLLSRRTAVPAFCILGALAGVLIAHDTRQRVFLQPADETNPYAYAHTSDDILGLSAEIADLTRRNALAKPRIAVIASDPWPLPWYLRHFYQVGFWQPGQQVAAADFYITPTEAAEQYTDRLRNFRPEFFGVRPGVLILLWSPEPK